MEPLESARRRDVAAGASLPPDEAATEEGRRSAVIPPTTKKARELFSPRASVSDRCWRGLPRLVLMVVGAAGQRVMLFHHADVFDRECLNVGVFGISGCVGKGVDRFLVILADVLHQLLVEFCA